MVGQRHVEGGAVLRRSRCLRHECTGVQGALSELISASRASCNESRTHVFSGSCRVQGFGEHELRHPERGPPLLKLTTPSYFTAFILHYAPLSSYLMLHVCACMCQLLQGACKAAAGTEVTSLSALRLHPPCKIRPPRRALFSRCFLLLPLHCRALVRRLGE